jgi:Glutaredoxin-like domain (DUF836)
LSPDHNHIATVQLYTKAGCHLCEQAEADLDRLRRNYPHRVERVDITTDAALTERYGELIPVLVIQTPGGARREYAAPMSAAQIERALAEVLAR